MTALFDPIHLRSLTLRNRIVVAPMCQYSAIEGSAQPWHHVHLGQLALSGASLLILEATAVEAIGRITPGCLGLYNDENEAALAELLSVLRGLNPSAHVPVCIQLGHAGRKASSFEPWNGGQQIPLEKGGWQAMGPGDRPHIDGELPPIAMSASQLDALLSRFVQAVQRAERLGIDAIEVHAAHGYLLHQFLSPVANNRTDEYGGALENRMRYPLQVFKAMRAAWPENKPMGIRISTSDWDSNSSWDTEEAIIFCQAIEKAGADWIDASSGGVSRNQKIVPGPGYQVHFAQAIKKAVTTPVMAVGLITEAGQAQEIIESGQADMVALARAFLYNPRWAWHAAAQLGATVDAPPQYWRCEPHGTKGLFGETKTGQR
ncbi:MAG: NADH:flavin oxidoreductase/NADH oxidase [Burkholderiaceae bacterium]